MAAFASFCSLWHTQCTRAEENKETPFSRAEQQWNEWKIWHHEWLLYYTRCSPLIAGIMSKDTRTPKLLKMSTVWVVLAGFLFTLQYWATTGCKFIRAPKVFPFYLHDESSIVRSRISYLWTKSTEHDNTRRNYKIIAQKIGENLFVNTAMLFFSRSRSRRMQMFDIWRRRHFKCRNGPGWPKDCSLTFADRPNLAQLLARTNRSAIHANVQWMK